LDKFHKVRDYLYNLRCPYCGDSEKFKNKARGYFYRVKDQMNFRCHNCDYGTTAGNVVKYIDPETYKEYVKESFFPTENEIEYKFEEPKFKKRDPKLKDLVPINKLNTDHPAHQVLVTRQIPEEHYDKFYLCHKFYAWSEISSNKDHPRLVIPFYDEDGKVFAAQGRAFGNEQPKYLTVKFDDKPKIFGLERVDFSKRVYVVEGPIDSLFLHNCLAVAGADFNNLQKEDTTIILDNEPRNKEIVRRMENLIDVDYELVIWPDSIQQKDINDMTLAGIGDIQTIIDNNTFSGLQAKMRLATWKRI
jgi:hypothetical protein